MPLNYQPSANWLRPAGPGPGHPSETLETVSDVTCQVTGWLAGRCRAMATTTSEIGTSWYQLRSPLHGAARPCGAAMRSLLPAAWRHATAAHASAKRDAPERPARSVEAVHSRRLRA